MSWGQPVVSVVAEAVAEAVAIVVVALVPVEVVADVLDDVDATLVEVMPSVEGALDDEVPASVADSTIDSPAQPRRTTMAMSPQNRESFMRKLSQGKAGDASLGTDAGVYLGCCARTAGPRGGGAMRSKPAAEIDPCVAARSCA
ncbi:MAG TPA: hypothetical protein PKV55_13435 [Nitrospira sp.]|nr:hypothetical protein [Nitrospira sp.]HNK14610.1 hypothetical protein [Nitrospira sp.]